VRIRDLARTDEAKQRPRCERTRERGKHGASTWTLGSR